MFKRKEKSTDVKLNKVEMNMENRMLLRKQVKKQVDEADIFENEVCLNDMDYISCVSDILIHPKFQKMNNFIQHGNTTTMQHCMYVSYITYKFCKKNNLDYKSATRGALLHDLFLYDWHTYKKSTGHSFHGLTHPRIALKNANRFFTLNDMEQDIILKHMWPITLVPPKYKEGFVVMYVDKYCGFAETVKRIRTAFKVRRAL